MCDFHGSVETVVYIFTARSELRKVLFLALSVIFCQPARPAWRPAWRAYVLVLLLSFFFFFNDGLEQRDIRTYQTDLHQILGLVDMWL